MYRFGSGRRSATINLILANGIVFLLSYVVGRQFYSFFGLTPAMFISRPWTLFTAMFIHYGIGHIFTNMFTLYFFGDFLTRLVGEGTFLLVYLLGGVVGNVFYLLWGPAFTTAVGASGAIFALGGALAVMRPRVRVVVFPIPLPMPLWIAIVGGFLILWLIPGVAWQAHLGGLLFGALAGLLLRRRERRIF